MIDFLVCDEIDRIIELGQFQEIQKIFKFMFKEALVKSQKDENFEKFENLRETVEFNGKVIEVYKDDEIEEKKRLTNEEIRQAKFIQAKRRTILVSATLTKVSGTSRMIQNKKFKKYLKKNMKKNSTTNEQIHPKIMDIIKKIKFSNKLKIIDHSKETKGFLPEGLKIYHVECTTEQRMYYLDYLLTDFVNKGLVIIFVNSINASKKIKNILKQLGHSCVDIHSHMRQSQRIKKLESFLTQKRRILISTDVASRGIDVKNVQAVFHYHTPRDLDTFVHRSGRTARINTEGKSIVITDAHDGKRFQKYKRDLGEIHKLDFKPSDVFRNEVLVDKALEIERQEHLLQRREKDRNWERSMAKEVGLDFEADMRDTPKESSIKKQKRELKQMKRYYKQIRKKNEEEHSRQFSSFLSPMDIQQISQNLKKLKKS